MAEIWNQTAPDDGEPCPGRNCPVVGSNGAGRVRLRGEFVGVTTGLGSASSTEGDIELDESVLRHLLEVHFSR